MMKHTAFPHLYDCSLKIRDPAQFVVDYPNQATINDAVVLTTPNRGTLMVWAESCLGLDAFQMMHRKGGWSPFRSGEVMITTPNGKQEMFYYKLGDDGEKDFAAIVDGRTISIQPWLRTVSLFAKLALNLYILKCEDDTLCYPHLVVRKMLHSEWGESDNDFAYLLVKQGFDPKLLDTMVKDAWQRMIKLPLPVVFSYIHDEEVAVKMIDMCSGALQK